eukprot:CAMPEP_0119128880 /NCGR_PEP_ID=MMETSP1310-20130426/6848_1 /TAXON_ID=464262 /ORGANISM="Genus nov. species nov., Strain RCC2339" /LENGTH=560 /DNA_ID=CAMNT_0007119253 /DNA_START=83 /DNA_END=1762 /DNA_ORIENTATION=+
MKWNVVVLVGVAWFFANVIVVNAEYGGVGCAACTVLVRMIELSVAAHTDTVEDSLSHLCIALESGGVPLDCHKLALEIRDVVFPLLLRLRTPDRVCGALGSCTAPEICPLFPYPNPNSRLPPPSSLFPLPSSLPLLTPPTQLLSLSGYLQSVVQNIASNLDAHTPVDDPDSDGFSHHWRTLRGRSWRGRDCEAHASKIYPGRKPFGGDVEYDSNCNGIYGVDAESGIPYEELYCSHDQRGIMVLGDSIGAHFALPTSWYFPGEGVYDDFFFTLANELCWPQLSTYTGFIDNITFSDNRWDNCPDTWQNSTCPSRSIYMNMRNRNLCMHRDYQNLSVSGADSGLAYGNVKVLARNQTRDQPVTFFYAMIGDDICDHGSEEGWSTPQEFRVNVLKTLSFLNETLPPESSVILIGLVNGEVLWDVLSEHEYPLQDITYANWWDWLNCLDISYCWGWLNSNATIRHDATVRANELTQQLRNIVATVQFSNFDMAFYDYPLVEVLARWKLTGRPLWELIEPFDGLHLSQVGNALANDALWEKIAVEHPTWIGTVNPHNAEIRNRF